MIKKLLYERHPLVHFEKFSRVKMLIFSNDLVLSESRKGVQTQATFMDVSKKGLRGIILWR
jgi:hypothetical protein